VHNCLTHMHNLRNPIGQKIEQTKNTRIVLLNWPWILSGSKQNNQRLKYHTSK